jgi:hypothetical protein
MRCGRFSSSSCRPTGSFFGAARSPSRSAILRHKKDRGVCPDRDAGIALFDLDEGCATDRSTDVAAELAQGMPYPGSGITTDDPAGPHI